MAQPPIKADALQIAPGSGYTLLLEQDAVSHGLKFTDPAAPAGILLSQMANLATIRGVLLVGKEGSGATYTTLQAALDAVSASSSATNPSLILVCPGVYTENVTWSKDGVTLQCLGRVVLQGTLTIAASVSTTPVLATVRGLTVVQATGGQACVVLTGGAGSTVGSSQILLEDCDLLPTGVGGFSVVASTVNNIVLRNCRTQGVPTSASMTVTQCASLQVHGGVLPALQVDYSSTGSLPSVSVGAYILQGCLSVGNVLTTLTGGGSITLASCNTVGNVTANGNRTLTLRETTIGTLTLNDTVAATARSTTRSTATGTGTLLESRLSGSAVFTGTDHVAVTFPVARPSTAYGVNLDAGLSDQPWVTSKTTTGFTIQFSAPVTTQVAWSVLA